MNNIVSIQKLFLIPLFFSLIYTSTMWTNKTWIALKCIIFKNVTYSQKKKDLLKPKLFNTLADII